MPERISDELLAQAPVTHDEHARALRELIYECVMLNRRKDADAQQDAALARLAALEAGEDVTIAPEPDSYLPRQIVADEEFQVMRYPTGKAKPKAKKEK